MKHEKVEGPGALAGASEAKRKTDQVPHENTRSDERTQAEIGKKSNSAQPLPPFQLEEVRA